MPIIEQLVAFAILMENGGGILDKSPSYIKEKFKECESIKGPPYVPWFLDNDNRLKYIRYFEKWG